MKKKTKKKLVITISVFLLLLAVGYFGYRFVMGYLGSKAMNMVISNQLEGMLDRGEITLEELEEIAEAPPPEASASADITTEQNTEPSDIAPKKETAPKKTQSTQPSPTRDETLNKVSEKIEQSVSRQEKDEMMRLISSRLTSADIKFLAGLMSGGLTPAEGSRAAKLAYSRFDDAEISKIKGFWYKYKKGILKK